MCKTHASFQQSKNNVNGQENQKYRGKNPIFLAFLQPDWFLPYVDNVGWQCVTYLAQNKIQTFQTTR
jgi:hypothetical protein